MVFSAIISFVLLPVFNDQAIQQVHSQITDGSSPRSLCLVQSSFSQEMLFGFIKN